MGKDTMLELAWGIIANAGYGNWETQSPDWQQAAARWRDDYFNLNKIFPKSESETNALTELIQVLEKYNILHTVEFNFYKKEKYLHFDDSNSEGRATIVFNYEGNWIGTEISN